MVDEFAGVGVKRSLGSVEAREDVYKRYDPALKAQEEGVSDIIGRSRNCVQ